MLVVAIALVVAGLAVVHEAGTLAAGRLLGLRGRIKLTSLALVEVEGVHVAGLASPARRAGVILAGFAAAYVALAGAAFVVLELRGMPAGSHLVVRSMIDDMPAARVLRTGDRLVAIDGLPLPRTSLADHVDAKQGAAVTLTVARGDVVSDITLVPRQYEGRWRLGLAPGLELDYVSDPGVAAAEAARFPIAELAARARGLYHSIAPADPEVGGPTRITEEFPGGQRPYAAVLTALMLGSYVWLLLGVLDLVRLVRTPT